MTEERPTMTDEQEAAAGARPATNELLQELQSLGRQLTDAFKALWESEESRQVRHEIKEGFVELSQEIDEAIKTAQESEAAKEFSRQVKETVERAREGEIVEKVEASLAEGLRKLNQELSKATRSTETPAEPPQDETGIDL